MPQKDTFPLHPKRILFIRPGALGDFLLSLPVLDALRKRFPSAHIEVMGYPSILEIIKGRHYADRIVRFDQVDMAYFFLKDASLPSTLKGYFSHFDVIVPCLKDSGGVFTENLRRAGARSVFPLEPFPPEGGGIHVIDHLVGQLGEIVTHEEGIPRVFLNEEDREDARNFLSHEPGWETLPIVALHPGSGSRKKCWPTERFAALAASLRNRLGVEIALVTGPADGEVTAKFLELINPPPLLLEGLPLPRLGAILERCIYYIGNDSGISHLAAALGVPTVAIFGPTDARVWGPRGRMVTLLQGRSPCSPCPREEMLTCQEQMCLKGVGIEGVIEAGLSISNVSQRPQHKEGLR